MEFYEAKELAKAFLAQCMRSIGEIKGVQNFNKKQFCDLQLKAIDSSISGKLYALNLTVITHDKDERNEVAEYLYKILGRSDYLAYGGVSSEYEFDGKLRFKGDIIKQ